MVGCFYLNTIPNGMRFLCLLLSLISCVFYNVPDDTRLWSDLQRIDQFGIIFSLNYFSVSKKLRTLDNVFG